MRLERSKLYCFFGDANMALIKLGAAIVDARGSIAGTTFSRNKSGAYIRARVKPVNPKSFRQEFIRTVVSLLAEWWHTNLTAVERGLWETYAAAVAMKNGLGEVIHLSGFNHFIRTNCPQRMLGEAIIEAAPTTLSLMQKDETTLCSEEDIAAQTFTFTFDDTGWGPGADLKYWLVFYQGQPQLASRQTYHGPWRFMSAAGTVAGGLGTQTLPAEFSFAEGQKVWFQARMISQSGRTSEIWQLSPRTIVADP